MIARGRSVLIRGGTLIDRSGVRRGDILIRGERIAAVGPLAGEESGARAELFDASGALVIPGGVDAHTHFDLPVGAVSSADDFESGTLAAACGGTTCVIDFAGAGRESPEEALRTWHAKAGGKAFIDYGFHLTVTSVPDDPDEGLALFSWFLEQGVSSVKLYMAYPERLMVDDATLRRGLVAGRAAGVLVCVHAEDGNEVERRTAEALAAGRTGPVEHPRTRPPEVEAAAIRRAAALASGVGASIYVVHLSSAAGLAEVRAARSSGIRVLAETCPQYLWLTADRLEGPPDEAQHFVCAPALRADADREALWQGMADGSIQVMATDHCPFTKGDRRAGVTGRGWTDFTEIPGGLPGVETRLALTYQGVRADQLTPERWVDVVAGAPARLLGLAHRKGSLAPGMDADVVIFDPEATRSLDPSSLHTRSDHSPYQGIVVGGWPSATFARGRLVARDGQPVDAEPGWGRFVARRISRTVE
jgi:dihydropyrimidinase